MRKDWEQIIRDDPSYWINQDRRDATEDAYVDRRGAFIARRMSEMLDNPELLGDALGDVLSEARYSMTPARKLAAQNIARKFIDGDAGAFHAVLLAKVEEKFGERAQEEWEEAEGDS